MKRSLVVAPTVVIAGLVAAAALAASAGSFAEPLPGPRAGVILPTQSSPATPQPTATPTGTTGPGRPAAAAPSTTRPASHPTHQPTGSGQGKRQQGQPVSNPGPKHP